YLLKNDPYVNPNTSGAVRSKPNKYSCPSCDKIPTDDDYMINGIKYPIILNENEGGDMDGSYYNWDEIHICGCGTKYWFRNGAY
ncbi:MAG: hypothetical protein ACOC2W_03155, partial [bacterium]